jgi:hypothetical protein
MIISSGPSLEQDLIKIKDYNEKSVIITGIRNLKAMLESGIKPHIVCVLDSSEKMYNFIDGLNLKGMIFLFCEQSNNKVVEIDGIIKVFCSVLFPKFLNKLSGRVFDTLEEGGSVSHLATSLAVYMGCKNIIFVGQDLAYNSLESHSKSVTFNDIDKNIEKKGLIFVKGNSADSVQTDLMLNGFKIWFEDFISNNSHINFINSSLNGAYINGTKVSELNEALRLNCNEYIDPIKILNKLMANEYNNKLNFEEMQIEFDTVKTLNSKSIELANNLYKVYDEQNSQNEKKILEEMQSIDKKVEEKSINEVISALTYETFERIIKEEKYIENMNDDNWTRGKKFALKMNEFFKVYESGIEKLEGELKWIFLKKV